MKTTTILVTGDYVLDHHIYEGQRLHYADRRHRGVREVEELGGAALIHYLLAELAGGVASHLSVALGKKKGKSRTPVRPKRAQLPRELGAYAIWRPFCQGGGNVPGKAMWRTENAMGFGSNDEQASDFQWPVNPDVPSRPDMVVLSDGGMGFRDTDESWPEADALESARWIVLKTAHPLREGKLWTQLTKPGLRDKLVVIVSSSDLRKGPAWIAGGLSWDSTVESVLAALAPGGPYEQLRHCRHLVIGFGTEGALWLENGSAWDNSRAHLVYDAACVEGEHFLPETRGRAFGVLSCLAASVVWRLARAPERDAPDLETALERGLAAMRDLLARGHGSATTDGKGFPADRLAGIIKEASCQYSRISFDATAPASVPVCKAPASVPKDQPCWSLIHEALLQQGQSCPDPAWDLAERIARHGPIALASLPHLSIGHLMSADRNEIESMRILRHLIIEYKNRPPEKCKKPLSIGVFGPPGAGKSFAVQQIAQALFGKEGWLEFNLSQFRPDRTDDLIGAFHQIRDWVLRACTPVVFFDEFDCRDYTWLQFLLAPMQDGAFQEGQITHPIGKCIFIFAGATSWSFESFGPPPKSPDYAKFIMAKGPDFKSRLDGFIDVLAPNRRKYRRLNVDETAYEEIEDPCDIFFSVRRALVTRAEFGCKPTDRLDMDAGLLHGLLRAPDYRHGARSLAKLVEPLKPGYPGAVRRSLLPPSRQLGLHVKAKDFLEQCDRVAPPPPSTEIENPEPVAVEIHEAYRRLGLEQGWVQSGSKKDVDFAQLADFYKESNRQAAQRMAKVLGAIGLKLAPGKQTPAETEAVRRRIEFNLELLAELEHEGWMDWHLDQGWQQGDKKDNDDLTVPPKTTKHPCLRPYLDLSEEERNKDRNTVRLYLDFSAAARMKIVPLSPPPPPPSRKRPNANVKRRRAPGRR